MDRPTRAEDLERSHAEAGGFIFDKEFEDPKFGSERGEAVEWSDGVSGESAVEVLNDGGVGGGYCCRSEAAGVEGEDMVSFHFLVAVKEGGSVWHACCRGISTLHLRRY